MSEQMICHKEPHNPYAIIEAENAAMMEHIIKLQLVMDVQLKALKQQAKELAALRDFAIWLTGCGYDFTQHQYYLDNRHLLTGSKE